MQFKCDAFHLPTVVVSSGPSVSTVSPSSVAKIMTIEESIVSSEHHALLVNSMVEVPVYDGVPAAAQ